MSYRDVDPAGSRASAGSGGNQCLPTASKITSDRLPLREVLAKAIEDEQSTN